jgi:hypothetical protein
VAFARLLKEDLENRVLDFDSAAATEAAPLAAAKNERPVDMRDTQIAGIVLAPRATLATRNVRHFRDLKISIVDPWVASAEPSQQLSAQFRVAAPSERMSEVGFVPLAGTIEISLRR